jgi:hypothetical protein
MSQLLEGSNQRYENPPFFPFLASLSPISPSASRASAWIALALKASPNSASLIVKPLGLMGAGAAKVASIEQKARIMVAVEARMMNDVFQRYYTKMLIKIMSTMVTDLL